MIRFIKRIATFLVLLFLVGAFGYLYILPKVLPREYQAQVEKYSHRYSVEESLVYAVIFCESRFDPQAVSHAGAKGLMQVTTETGWWVASQNAHLDAENLDLFDPDTNIEIGCWYLNWLDQKFQGVQDTALAGYNAGHGNVQKWLADDTISADGITLEEIPFGETKSYVKKVELMQKLYEWRYGEA